MVPESQFKSSTRTSSNVKALLDFSVPEFHKCTSLSVNQLLTGLRIFMIVLNINKTRQEAYSTCKLFYSLNSDLLKGDLIIQIYK